MLTFSPFKCCLRTVSKWDISIFLILAEALKLRTKGIKYPHILKTRPRSILKDTSSHSRFLLLLGHAFSKPLQGPGLGRDPEQGGRCCPHSQHSCSARRKGMGQGSGGRVLRRGSLKGREKNQQTPECPHIQRKLLPRGLPSSPFSLLLLISPPNPSPLQGPSLASPAPIWNPARRSRLALQACHVCV